MWFVSDSESPTVATSGAAFPRVTSAIAPSARRALAGELERAHHRLGVVGEVERADRSRRLERVQRVVERLREAREPLVEAAEHRDRDLLLPRQEATDGEHEEQE